MNKLLKKYLDENEITVVNPIKESKYSAKKVGYHLRIENASFSKGEEVLQDLKRFVKYTLLDKSTNFVKGYNKITNQYDVFMYF